MPLLIAIVVQRERLGHRSRAFHVVSEPERESRIGGRPTDSKNDMALKSLVLNGQF